MKNKAGKVILSKSEKYFVNDLYQLIIGSASDPVDMMEKLSVTLREFIGAAEIVLFECVFGRQVTHRMISNIRSSEKDKNRHLSLADFTHDEVYEITYYEKGDLGFIGEALMDLDFEDVLIVPILSKNRRVGCMHVFGSFHGSVQEQTVRLFTSIRPLMGVILENYKLFNRMDEMLRERTEGLNDLNREMANLIQTVPDLIVVTDGALRIVKIYNYDSERYYFKPLSEGMDFLAVINRKQYEEKFQYLQALEGDAIVSFMEEIIWGNSINYLENRVMKTSGKYLHIIRNISEQINSQKTIDFMNKYDQLTGLYNRTTFYRLMEQYREKQSLISVMIVDMNGLKLLNETLGFNEGDRYLKLLAEACKKVKPAVSVLGRVGDDELAFVIPGGDKQIAQRVAERLNEEVDKLNYRVLKRFPLSISIGLYCDTAGDKGCELVFSMAEQNLNQEKLLHAESKKSTVVRALTKALEVRDFITEGHADRMESLLETFGKKMNFTGNEIVNIRLLGKFHDIGKVGISDAILFKPGKLNDHEYEEMKKHSEIGYRIALTAAELHPVAELILKHHERYDGKGYPIGQLGEDIPLACRILSIVDAFDAMTNDRPYRKALTQEVAIDELRVNKGTQFDPELVDFFIDHVLD